MHSLVKQIVKNVLLLFVVFQNGTASVYTDSLKLVLKKNIADTERVKTLTLLAKKTRTENLDSSYAFATQAYDLAIKCGDSKQKLIAQMYQGLAKYFMGKPDEALKLYFEALNEAEKTKYETYIPQLLTNIGIAYENQQKLEEALKIHNKALHIFLTRKDEKGSAISYSNIGSVYYKKKNYKEALSYYIKAKDIVEKYGNKAALAGEYNNIGNVYSDLKDLNKALDYYFKSLGIKKELGNKDGIALTEGNIGSLYCEKKEYTNGIKYCNMAVEICKEVGSDNLLKDTYLTIATCYEGMKNYPKAFEYLKLYSDLKDTLYNTESGKAMAEMEVKFKTSEKDKELLLKDLEIKDRQSKQKQQQITVLALCAGLVLAIVALFFVLKGYRDKQRAHALIARQKELVEEKQKEIIDSINYASRIQRALITSERYIEKSLNKLKKE